MSNQEYELKENMHQFMVVAIDDKRNIEAELPEWCETVYHDVLVPAFVAIHICSVTPNSEYTTLGYTLMQKDYSVDLTEEQESERDNWENELLSSDYLNSYGGGYIQYLDPNNMPSGFEIENYFEIDPKDVLDEMDCEKGDFESEEDFEREYDLKLQEMALEATL